MSNHIISNKQNSILDLSPLRDTAEVVIVLRPKSSAGDSREVSQETAENEVAVRAKTAGWIDITAASTKVAAPVAAVAEVTAAEVAEVAKTAAETAMPPPLPAPEPEVTAPAEHTTETATVSETPVDSSSRTFPSEMPAGTPSTSETPVDSSSRTFPSEASHKSKRR